MSWKMGLLGQHRCGMTILWFNCCESAFPHPFAPVRVIEHAQEMEISTSMCNMYIRRSNVFSVCVSQLLAMPHHHFTLQLIKPLKLDPFWP